MFYFDSTINAKQTMDYTYMSAKELSYLTDSREEEKAKCEHCNVMMPVDALVTHKPTGLELCADCFNYYSEE